MDKNILYLTSRGIFSNRHELPFVFNGVAGWRGAVYELRGEKTEC
jgi:hypothetical protein